VIGLTRRNETDPPPTDFGLAPEALRLQPEYQFPADEFFEMIAGSHVSGQHDRVATRRRDGLPDSGNQQAEKKERDAKHQAMSRRQ